MVINLPLSFVIFLNLSKIQPMQHIFSLCKKKSAYQASSTWKPFFLTFGSWPTAALIHSTKEATGCLDWSQSETLFWRFHPTYSFPSSDEYHSVCLKININYSLLVCWHRYSKFKTISELSKTSAHFTNEPHLYIGRHVYLFYFNKLINTHLGGYWNFIKP